MFGRDDVSRAPGAQGTFTGCRRFQSGRFGELQSGKPASGGDIMAQYIDERGDVVSTAQTNRREELTPVEARQGLLGRPVLMVLIGGLILAFLVSGGAEMWGESQD